VLKILATMESIARVFGVLLPLELRSFALLRMTELGAQDRSFTAFRIKVRLRYQGRSFTAFRIKVRLRLTFN